MTTEQYGGDEINAAVIDTGAAWTRIGLSGSLGPSVTVPSAYMSYFGREHVRSELPDPPYEGADGQMVTPQVEAPQTPEERVYHKFSDVDFLRLRQGASISPLLEESVPTDWAVLEELWAYGLEQSGIDATEAPILFTEQIWATDEQRTKTLEVALESLQTPATYIMKSPVCSLFSAGRGSGLVIDAGHQTLSVTPVVDGLALYKPMRRSLKAGAYLDAKIRALIGEPVPTFKVASREIVGLAAPKFVERETAATPSYTSWFSNKVVQDFKESMVEVSVGSETSASTAGTPAPGQGTPAGTGSNTPAPDSHSPKSYEFPDGHSVEYSTERFQLGDALFEGDDDDHMEDEKISGWSSKGASQLVVEAINACDVDLRANLANNIVVTGGTSLLPRFVERINADVTSAFPGLKVRIHAPGNYVERKNSAWIGGSITASLGTFHQLWVSKQEYDEVGADQLVKKRFH